MKHILVVVDMQKDFVDGALGSEMAVAILPEVVKTVQTHEGPILVTLDTHEADYLSTREGRFLPVPHCIKGTEGWKLHGTVLSALEGKAYTVIEKETFGSVRLAEAVRAAADGEAFDVTLLGLCTDICVVSNAMLLKAAFPEADLFVLERACAGVTKEAHDAAIRTMRSCQIEIL